MAAPLPGQVVDGYRFMGGNPKDRAAWAAVPKLGPQEQKQLIDIRAGARSAQEAAAMGGEFLAVNKGSKTGQVWGLPGLSELATPFSDSFQKMQAITNRMAPQLRQAGSGAMSDKDVALFKRSVPNVDFGGPANADIVRRLREEAEDRAAYADFADRYVTERGTLNGLDAAWRQQRPKRKPQAAAATGGFKYLGPE